jgi:Tfp pilus assembly protein PilN
MSVHSPKTPVLEWSPGGLTVFNPATGQLERHDSAASAARSIGGGRVLVALSRRSAFIRALRVPNASLHDVRLALRVHLDQLFPVPVEELSFSLQLTSDVTPEGRMAIVAAAPHKLLRRVAEELKAVGLEAEAVIPAAFGSAGMARALGFSTGAVVERTVEGVAIDVVVDGDLRSSRVVPDEDDPDQLMQEIERSHQMAGVHQGEIHYVRMPAASGSERSIETPTLSWVSAALREGVELELPEQIERRERGVVHRRMRLALLAAAAAVAIVSLTVSHRMEAQRVAQKADRRWESILRQLESVKNGLASRALATSKSSQVLNVAFRPAQSPSDVLTLAGNLAPAGVWLTGVTFERGKPLLVRGTAKTTEAVTEYLESLSRQDRFRDVKLVFANNAMIETTPIVNFSISAHVLGNFPIVETKGAGR